LAVDHHLQIKKLDDTEFKNAFSKGYIRVSTFASIRFSSWKLVYVVNHAPSSLQVKEYDGKQARSYSRSRSPSRSRSRSARFIYRIMMSLLIVLLNILPVF
jgi:arginine/serine-rich splicing factor 1/9